MFQRTYGLLGYQPRWQRWAYRAAEALALPAAFVVVVIAAGLFS